MMPRSLKATLQSLLACSAVMTLAGCENTIKPFNLNIGEVGEPEPAQHAQIVFSSPRVYARETLINDRLTEISYLMDALDASKSATFGPELQRELESISSLAVQLRAAFNPAAGDAFRDARGLNDLQQEIDKTQLTLQLETLQRQLDALKAADGKDTEAGNDDSQPGEGGDASTGLRQESTDIPELTDLDAFKSLVASVKDLKAELDGLGKNIKVGKAENQLTPEEIYRRRRDHRAEIRADLAASRLDDVHGANGNGLYRTQFLASVVPPSGSDTNRWGVARMVVEPPQLTESEVQSLYFDWLAHVTGRLNRVRVERQKDESYGLPQLLPDALYDRLGSNSSLYSVARVQIAPNCKVVDGNTDCTIPVAVPSDRLAHFLSGPYELASRNLKCIASITALDSFGGDTAANGTTEPINPIERLPREGSNGEVDEKNSGGIVDRPSLRLGGGNEPGASSAQPAAADVAPKEATTPPTYLGRIDFFARQGTSKAENAPKREAKSALEHQPSVRSDTFELLQQTRQNYQAYCAKFHEENGSNQEVLLTFMRKLVRAGPTVQAMYRSLGERVDLPGRYRSPALELLGAFDRAATNAIYILDRSGENIGMLQADGRRVPAQFCKHLFSTDCPTGKTQVAALGSTLAIAVTPTDEAQRVSTLQRAAHAMQLALGLAATVPQSGINLQGGVNYLNAAAGSVDALERVPRVIGFAGRLPKATNQAAFGWLFGPEIGVDSESNQLELRQTAMDRIVTADVSVPGWWPRMTLKAETMWGGELDNLQFTDGGSLNRTGGSPVNNMSGPVTTSQAIEVALPLNSADLDGLTGLLAKRSGHGGRQQVRIDWVDPEIIRNCTDDATLVVQGSELWREPRAFFAGIPNKGTIEVLPDMGGLQVTFDFSTLADRLGAENGKHQLMTVWTRGGEARWPIKVACKQPKEQSKKEKLPESFERELAAMKAAAESAIKEVKAQNARLLDQLKKMADVSQEPAKAIDMALKAVVGKADGLLTKAVNDDGSKKGLTKLIAEAKPIDSAVGNLLIAIDRAKLLGESTADLDAELAGQRGLGNAKLIRAKEIKAAFDLGTVKLKESLAEQAAKIEKLIPST